VPGETQGDLVDLGAFAGSLLGNDWESLKAQRVSQVQTQARKLLQGEASGQGSNR
jgi:hypothetical protein